MRLQMEQLIELKNKWMASHITDAEYPTPLSEKGLSLYQSYLQQLSHQPLPTLSAQTNNLSLYPVDCHPLTIRYALVLASKWENESEKEALIEYLTQIMFEPSSPAQLFVGFFKGKPAACGMIYSDSVQGDLITDVHALPLPNQQALIDEMTAHLAERCQAGDILVES
ncbi:hypothetical protein C9I98_11035 [Photobacterium sanctipauli]|uniref:Flavodoxin n=2 Tax=Photobacterium sanctipauli TaxID=1342794 RepID=A0A2T3NUT2_9GAMM|nr:hypothetical protein C9I98_11035 [Photobacterium sanctipauli]